METLATQIEKVITDLFPNSFVMVRASSNICNSICIRFALEPKNQWSGGYFENASYLVSHVWNVSESGAVLQKTETGKYSFEKSSGRLSRLLRNKNTVNSDQLIKHITKQFENIKKSLPVA